MERALVKSFFDACRYAKHITDSLPALAGSRAGGGHHIPDASKDYSESSTPLENQDCTPACNEIAPHHIYTIGALHSLAQQNGSTSIADVASYLGVSHKTAGEYLRDLHHKGLLCKVETIASVNGKKQDKRHIRVALTDRGKEYHAQYVEKYYDCIMDLFKSINNNDMNTAIRVIKQAYYLMTKAISSGQA